jgi:hypothetical protein
MEHFCHLKPPFCHLVSPLAVSRVATTRPLTHPPRAGGGGGSTPPPPATILGLASAARPVCPPPPSALWLPPYIYFLSHYTIQNPTAYGTRSHSITTHIHTLSTVHVLVLVHAYTLRAAVCAPAAPGPPRQFLACMLQGGRQYAWYVWEDYITAHTTRPGLSEAHE